MAISDSQAILAMLKVYYKDRVENLFARNSPLLKKLNKERVEGKVQNFPAIYSYGGAVSSDALVAESKAAENFKAAEFSVTPGKLFSIFSYNLAEVQASKTKRGAYMKVAGTKAFAATEAFRKALAASLYGQGWGEVAVTPEEYSFVQGTAIDITLPADAIIKMGVNLSIVFKAAVTSTSTLAEALITAKDTVHNTITVVPTTTVTVPQYSIVAFKGAMDASGNPRAPMGLDGWLPVVAGRTGTEWTTYINQSFFGASRSVDASALAGGFVAAASGEKVSTTLQKLMRQLRDAGSEADLIVMNSEDFLTFSNEIESTNTYWTATSTRAKRQANVGYDKFSASFSTNYIGDIIDDPYCPKGKAYILETDAVEYWTYTNADKPVDDGVAVNNPGTENPENFENAGKENDPYKLVIEDYLTVEPGTMTSDGSAVRVVLNFFGSVVVLNPAHCGVALLDGYDENTLIGYKVAA